MRARDRYLFIRILEACNADCFMCDFALSRDTFRFSREDFDDLLPKARTPAWAMSGSPAASR